MMWVAYGNCFYAHAPWPGTTPRWLFVALGEVGIDGSRLWLRGYTAQELCALTEDFAA